MNLWHDRRRLEIINFILYLCTHWLPFSRMRWCIKPIGRATRAQSLISARDSTSHCLLRPPRRWMPLIDDVQHPTPSPAPRSAQHKLATNQIEISHKILLIGQQWNWTTYNLLITLNKKAVVKASWIGTGFALKNNKSQWSFVPNGLIVSVGFRWPKCWLEFGQQVTIAIQSSNAAWLFERLKYMEFFIIFFIICVLNILFYFYYYF